MYSLIGNSTYVLAPDNPVLLQQIVIQENSILAKSSHWIPKYQVLADLSDYDSVKSKYPFVDCIIQNESGWNPKAIGDSGKAYGIFQFHRATFDLFSAKYNLKLNYTNPNDQLILFEKMMDEDLGLIRHWTSNKSCLGGKRLK